MVVWVEAATALAAAAERAVLETPPLLLRLQTLLRTSLLHLCVRRLLLLLLGVQSLSALQPLSLLAQPVLLRAHATAVVATALPFGEVAALLIVGPAVLVGLANAAPAHIIVERRLRSS